MTIMKLSAATPKAVIPSTSRLYPVAVIEEAEAVRMRDPLVIAVVQPPCVPYDVAANALAHAAVVRSADARVVVFPELSLTGYELDAPTITARDPRLAPIIEACAETGSVALVGAPVQGEADRSHIGMLAIDGTGARIVYRKVWLGGVEPVRFAPGIDPAVLEVDGWRLGLAICRDTGIPQHAADTAALGIDVYVAGMLESAEDAAILDMRARRVAADHGVWVAIASFAGSTGGGYGNAAGGSAIWTPDGVAIAQAGHGVGAIARATLGSSQSSRRLSDARSGTRGMP
jgi:predicted amidohydrolase